MSGDDQIKAADLKLHRAYMQRCLELAAKGLGTTDPNPMVGAVIVHKGKIIGEGWHQKAGQPHAEVNAINSVSDKSLLKEATIYVSLESCSHFGKTPPCADLIVAHQIPKVVVGSSDPNPKVSGNGIQRLKDAGIEVIEGILEKDCDWLNRRFFTYFAKKRPYVILKWAQTTDGFIAPQSKEKKEPVWISGAASKQLVHKWRSEESAILIGRQTAQSDNPSLTTRLWPGKSPLRVVIDLQGKLTDELNVLDDSVDTLVIGGPATTTTKNNTRLLEFPTKELSTEELMQILFNEGIQSVIIEGGTNTLNRFIASGLWDEARVFTGEVEFTCGIAAPKLALEPSETRMIQTDKLEIFHNSEQL